MPLHIKHEDKLNMLLWGLFGLKLLSGYALKWVPWVAQAVIAIAAISIGWTLAIFCWRLTHLDHEPRVYRRPTDGDYWRLFVCLWLGYGPLASQSESLFLLMSLIAVPTLFLLVTIGIADAVIEKKLTPLVIGCFAFVYFLFGWQKVALIEHYGVPIIGHFLEKPNFKARYYVEVEPESSDKKYKVLADIRVQSRSESEETGEDRFGMTTYSTFTYREIWIERFQFPNGGWIEVENQDEPLSIDDPGFVTDKAGRSWYVRMTGERTN